MQCEKPTRSSLQHILAQRRALYGSEWVSARPHFFLASRLKLKMKIGINHRNNWINSHNDSTTSIECISNEGSQSQNVLNFSPKVQKRFVAIYKRFERFSLMSHVCLTFSHLQNESNIDRHTAVQCSEQQSQRSTTQRVVIVRVGRQLADDKRHWKSSESGLACHHSRTPSSSTIINNTQ